MDESRLVAIPLSVLLAIACLALSACSDDSGSSTSPDADMGDDVSGDLGADLGGDQGGDAEPLVIERREPAPALLQVGSELGCYLDPDCADGLHCHQGTCTYECSSNDDCGEGETCSARGRCVMGESDAIDSADIAAVPEVVPGVGIAVRPEQRHMVADGDNEVVVTIRTTEPVPGGVISYRTELARGRTAETGRVRRAYGETEFELVLPAGVAAELEAAPNQTHTDEHTAESGLVVTSVGSFTVDIIPPLALAGTYAGEVLIPEFGQFGLPIEFQIVTDPPDAPLDDADTAWLVLPISATRLFSAFEASDGGPAFVASELTYDEFGDNWFATFRNEFRLADDSLLGGYPNGQIERSLRIELEPLDETTVIGRLSDRWEGFYDVVTDGDTEPAINVLEGDIEAIRFQGAMTVEEAEGFDVADAPGDPDVQPLPPLDACTDGLLTVADIVVDEVTRTCEGTDTVATFELADIEDQASCAIAVAETALLGDTTQSQIVAFLDDEIDDPGGLSFSEFMENCAAGTDGTCVPSEEVLCGRQLLAYAYASQDAEIDAAGQLVATYGDVTREAFLGRQLGAFQTDSDMRLTWLRTSDYPAIVTSAVKDLNERLLNEWVENVLDVHLGVLAGQFDASGLSVLSRAPTGEDAQAARQQLLLEMSQSWRASMDALTLAAERWHTLFQADDDRAEAAAFTSTVMFDLYVLSSVLSDINRAAGAGFANATFGGGFSSLSRELERLSLPFDELIYARDGEVVVTRSLDPDSTNDDVLDELEALALDELEDAAESVTGIIAEAEARALNETQIRNRMNNDIEDLRDELVRLCGLPVGCSRNDIGVEEGCEIRVEPGTCGFLIDPESGDYLAFEPGEQNTSAAGRALLSLTEAALDHDIALQELRAHTYEAQLAWSAADAFEQQVLDWQDERERIDGEIDQLLADDRGRQLQALADFRQSMEDQAELREHALDDLRDATEKWDEIRVDGVDEDMDDIIAITALNQTGGLLRDTADSIDNVAAIVADGMPKVLGTSNDSLAPARLATRMSAYGVTAGLRATAFVSETIAAGLDNALTRQQLTREARLSRLELEEELNQVGYDNELAVLEAGLEAIVFENDIERTYIDDLIGAMEGAFEVQQAHERDLIELGDRRDAAWVLIAQQVALEVRVLQAELTIQQRINEYLQVVQEGQLIAARLADLESQRNNVNRLLGSPAVVFAWANRLLQAESRLSRAKSAMMDWLVALEYFAVRPFMDQRLQILLARNTYQLEAIAAELRRLQRSCGGAVNNESAELSLRDDLLGIGFDSVDESTGDTIDSDERFAAVLETALIPVDKRVRYTTDSTVGDLVNRGDLLAATFTLDLDLFANLAATCNAKFDSIAVQLVGEGLGSGRPTVSILYDGTSRLRSCQPGIDEYVASFGPEATTFGSVTSFRTAGRAVSPVADIGEFGSPNTTLAGLPLSSQYTVLIDPELGENADIDWAAIEDIQLRLTYTYQDPFPPGQCE